MKTTVTGRITIAASTAHVFRYLSNLNLHPVWNPRIDTITPKTVVGLGSTYTTVTFLLGVKVTAQNTITDFEQDRVLEITNDTGMLHYRATYRLEPKGKKTVVTSVTNVASDKGTFSLAAPMFKLLARREIQTDLHLLKLVAEENSKA